MSKYDLLWEYVKNHGGEPFTLTFSEIESIAGFHIDHAFLTYKKELEEYGWKVGKISLKNETVEFEKIG